MSERFAVPDDLGIRVAPLEFTLQVEEDRGFIIGRCLFAGAIDPAFELNFHGDGPETLLTAVIPTADSLPALTGFSLPKNRRALTHQYIGHYFGKGTSQEVTRVGSVARPALPMVFDPVVRRRQLELFCQRATSAWEPGGSPDARKFFGLAHVAMLRVARLESLHPTAHLLDEK